MLQERDEAAAARIAALLAEFPASRVFALYGELHLAKSHLPARISGRIGKRKNILVIHQNEPTLYWASPKNSLGLRPEVVRLRKNEFCILSSVPWVKLKSYLDWLEGGGEEEEWRSEADAASYIRQLAQLLGEMLGSSPRLLESIENYGPDSVSSELSMGGLREATHEEKYLLHHALTYQRTTFLPRKEALILPALSTNALTESASLLLWKSFHPSPMRSVAVRGSRLVMQFFIGYLGSKMLNPKRKCNEVADLASFLHSHGRPKTKFLRKKKGIYLRALKILAGYLELKTPGPPRKMDHLAEIEACRLAGYVMANRFFLALSRDPKLIKFAKEVFTTSTASEKWADRLLLKIAGQSLLEAIIPPTKSSEF
jgi:hypothetical protein